MRIINTKTNTIHIVDEVLTVGDTKVYFTQDGICLPQSEVNELIDTECGPKTSQPKKDAEKIIKDWVEKILGTEEQFLNRQEFANKCNLGFIKKPIILNKFLSKFFKKVLYIEDNSVIGSKSKIFYRKTTLFTLNNKEYYLLSAI